MTEFVVVLEEQIPEIEVSVSDIALKGDTGEKGDDGDKGDTGDSISLTIGEVTEVAPGDEFATITGTAPNLFLNLGLPLGVTEADFTNALNSLTTLVNTKATPSDIATAIVALSLGTASQHDVVYFARPVDVSNAIAALSLGSASQHDVTYFARPSDVTTAVAGEAAARSTAINAAMTTLIGTAPSILDTLGELAAQLQSDETGTAAILATISTIQTAIATKAPLVSPNFTGAPLAPTPATADNSTSIATTAFVKAVVAALSSTYVALPTLTTPGYVPIVQSDGVSVAYGDVAGAASAAVSAAVAGLSLVKTTDPGAPNSLDVGTGALVRIDAADGTSTWLQANDVDGGPTTWATALIKSAIGLPAGNIITDTDTRLPKTIDVADGTLVRLDGADGTSTWLQANDTDGGPTAWSVLLIKAAIGLPVGNIITDTDGRLPKNIDVADGTFVRIDAADGTSTWLQANDVDGGPTQYALNLLQAAIGGSGSTYGYNLLKAGLTGATADIGALINAAVSQGYKRIIVPYQAAAWPCTTTIALVDTILEFEKGARISFNMVGISGMTVLRSMQINPSFTSPYTGPSSAADAASSTYAYPSREVLFLDGSRVLGTYYHENAVTGAHIHGADVAFLGDLKFKNIRHRTGWGNAFHADGGAGECSDIWVLGRIYIQDSDRGVEIEDSAHDVHFASGGYAKNVFPNGYTGQPTGVAGVGDAAPYATYTFVWDMGHAHDVPTGSGIGPYRITYKGIYVTENCGGALSTARSTGTADAIMPRDCEMDELHVIGRGMAGGYADVDMGGVNCRLRKVVFSVGSGVVGGQFLIQGRSQITGATANPRGNIVEDISGTPEALALLKILDNGTGLRVGRPAVPALNSPSGKWLTLGKEAVTTSGPGQNNILNLQPEYLPFPIPIDQVAAEIVTAGEAGSTVRIAIFSDSGGLPGDPIVDKTIDGTIVGVQAIALGTTAVIGPGNIWRGGVIQNAPTTPPVVRAATNGNPFAFIFAATAAALAGSAAATGQSKSGVSGALPSFGTTSTPISSAIRVLVRMV